MRDKPDFGIDLPVSDDSKFTIFEFDSAPKTMSSSALPIMEATSSEVGAIFRTMIDEGLDDGGYGKVLFNYGNESDGRCLLYSWFKPGFIVPRHSHGQDCLYLIISGSVVLGSRTLGPGSGFFVPADKPYAFHAGPDGVELVEFRQMLIQQTTATFLDTSAETWNRALETVRQQRAAWVAETVPPSQRQEPSRV